MSNTLIVDFTGGVMYESGGDHLRGGDGDLSGGDGDNDDNPACQ